MSQCCNRKLWLPRNLRPNSQLIKSVWFLHEAMVFPMIVFTCVYMFSPSINSSKKCPGPIRIQVAMAAWNQCRLPCQLGMCFAQCDFKQFQNCCWAEMTMVRCWENSEVGGKIWEKLPGLGIIFVSKSRAGKPQISSMLVMFRYHSILGGYEICGTIPQLLFEKCSKALQPHVRMLAFVVFRLWEPSKLIMEFTIAASR